MKRASQEQVSLAPSLIGKSEWVQVEPLVYQRPCIGQEHSASYNQNVAEGHTELSIAVTFSINVEVQELIERAKQAWTNCRLLHPEIAIELSTDFSIPQLMTYRILSTSSSTHSTAETTDDEEALKEWSSDTFVLVEDREYQEVLEMTYNRRLLTKGKQAMMYLVPDTRTSIADDERVHCIIWNVSHAVTDAYSVIAFVNTFLQETVKGSSKKVLLGEDGDHLSVVKHLPISPLVSYEKMYKPSEALKEESLQQAKDQLQLYKEKLSESIAMYPEPHHGMREHRTHCLATDFSLAESEQILSYLKQVKLSITYAGAAATIMAALEMYGKGHETGALLGMTRNARRWVATVVSNTGRIAIPMATDVVFLWIPFDTADFMKNKSRRERLLILGREIKVQLGKHLLSPHYLASVPYMSDIAVEGLRSQQELKAAIADAENVERETEEVVLASSPGFSSQGALALKKEFQSDTNVKIVRHHIRHTGRQVGTSPWIGMFSLDECLSFSIGFDGKYYSPEPMNRFLGLVRENVASLGRMQDSPVRGSKL
ncbi:hypothetical protein CBS101457_005263 [Exobasidium rhododendri]|nr:hypothetical protein CBS101457_005263 [Exobasidium rhododendri]